MGKIEMLLCDHFKGPLSLPSLSESGLLNAHINKEFKSDSLQSLPTKKLIKAAAELDAASLMSFSKPKLGRPTGYFQYIRTSPSAQKSNLFYSEVAVLPSLEQVSFKNSLPNSMTRRHSESSLDSAKASYNCDFDGCFKSFPSKARLKRHLLIHTGNKPYECLHSSCDKKFSRRDNMMQHYKIHLNKEKLSRSDSSPL